MKNHSELEKIHKSALKLIREQLKKHYLGKLVFLSFTGTRPWGIARKNVDYDYRGIYIPPKNLDSINGIYINNHAKDITMITLKKFIQNDLSSNIHGLICINSPIVYASKDFLEFRKWVNSHFSKRIYQGCQQKSGAHTGRKDFLYDFLFLGNGIAILEKKKVIVNLAELNKKILKIPALNKIIHEEKTGLPFRTETICKKTLRQLKARLEKAKQKTDLPTEVDKRKFTNLKIVKRIKYKP